MIESPACRARVALALACAGVAAAVAALSADGRRAAPHHRREPRARRRAARRARRRHRHHADARRPAPLVERSQWVFDLRWDRGDVWLLGVHPLELAAPQATPRAMGRFALELFEGPALIERVRFDFPLLGRAGAGRRRVHGAAVALAASSARASASSFRRRARGTRLELWDRATNRRWSLPWPPRRARRADGGAAASAAATRHGRAPGARAAETFRRVRRV